MAARIRNLVRTSQFTLLIIFAVTWLAFGLINPAIFTLASVYALIRASIVPALLSLALMLIMVQGSFDFSFAMIAAFSSYCAIYIIKEMDRMQAPLLVIMGLAILIAVGLETVNWFFIDKFKLQPFITTLGMQSLLKGLILAFISTSYIYTLPDTLRTLSTNYMATASFPDGTESVLHISVLVVLVAYVAAHLLLQYSSFGRKVYAIGASEEAAKRSGINVSRVRYISFALTGAVCGVAGIIHDALARATVPIPLDLVGQELTFIAAVTLGLGGNQQARGSVVGTFIAVLFLRFVGTNLIMLGIPSYWQRVVTGAILLIGLLAQVWGKRTHRLARR